jgi:hypothetical protein
VKCGLEKIGERGKKKRRGVETAEDKEGKGSTEKKRRW